MVDRPLKMASQAQPLVVPTKCRALRAVVTLPMVSRVLALWVRKAGALVFVGGRLVLRVAYHHSAFRAGCL